MTEIESPKHQSPIDSPVRFAPGQEFNRQVYAFGSPVAHPPPIEIRQSGYSQLDPYNVEFFTLVDVAKKLRKLKRYNDLFANARLPVKPTKPTDAYRDKFKLIIQGFNDTDKLKLNVIYNDVLNEKNKLDNAFKNIKPRVNGSTQEGGLYNDQIDKMMSRFRPSYLGCIMKDQIKTILPEIKTKRISFIINTQNHNQEGAHWQAVYIDSRDSPESSNSIEFYDSFGRTIDPSVLEDLKLVLKILKPSTVLKLKENKVIMQSDNSSNCGWFCVRFLLQRYRNKTFASATGWDDKFKVSEVTKNEEEINKMKNMPKFDYIF